MKPARRHLFTTKCILEFLWICIRSTTLQAKLKIFPINPVSLEVALVAYISVTLTCSAVHACWGEGEHNHTVFIFRLSESPMLLGN